jgi:mannose-6-phosphate isomerase-like protein (cupin superfamily)
MAAMVYKSLMGKRRFTRLVGRHGKLKGISSGLVVLKPKESVGEHTTGHKEEVIIILKGHAKVSWGKKSISVGENSFLYMPRHTVHNMQNSGRAPLKYVYLTVA